MIEECLKELTQVLRKYELALDIGDGTLNLYHANLYGQYEGRVAELGWSREEGLVQLRY